MPIEITHCQSCPGSYSSRLSSCPKCGAAMVIYGPKVETETRNEIKPAKEKLTGAYKAKTNTRKVNEHKAKGSPAGEFYQSTMHRKG